MYHSRANFFLCLPKANHRRRVDKNLPKFVYPYNLGYSNNCWQVINIWNTPLGDGINWPIRSGCDRYTFTVCESGVCVYGHCIELVVLMTPYQVLICIVLGG